MTGIPLTKLQKQQIISLFPLRTEYISKTLNISESAVVKALRAAGLTRDKRKYKINDNYFQKINSEAKAYFLGLLLADGCNYQDFLIKLSLSSKDKYILESFLRDTDSNYKIADQTTKKGNTVSNMSTISIVSRKMVADLLNFEFHQRKSGTMKMPQNIIGNEHFRHFIRGYFDGDGCIQLRLENKKSFKLRASIEGTQEFLSSLSEFLIKEIGIKKTLFCKRRNNDFNSYSLRISSNIDCYKFFSFIYDTNSTLFLKRKKDKFDAFKTTTSCQNTYSKIQ